MSKHTPGPWSVVNKPHCLIIMPCQAKVVPHKNAEADAHLIAAAPEMFDLCKIIHEQSGHCSPNDLSKLSEVITKAEGRDKCS